MPQKLELPHELELPIEVELFPINRPMTTNWPDVGDILHLFTSHRSFAENFLLKKSA